LHEPWILMPLGDQTRVLIPAGRRNRDRPFLAADLVPNGLPLTIRLLLRHNHPA
jgi:hypothetical protein